jgi:hypothetical protein
MFGSILKKALPVIVANAPAIIAMFKELKRALKKPAPKA